jgi:hypothetical protein
MFNEFADAIGLLILLDYLLLMSVLQPSPVQKWYTSAHNYSGHLKLPLKSNWSFV